MNKQLNTVAKIAAAAAASLALAGHASAATNLVKDGDFESFSSQVAANSWTTLATNTTFGAWTVTAGTVDLIRGMGNNVTGVSIDMNGTSAGTLTQTFNAVAGMTYTLSFDRNHTNSGWAGLTAQLGSSTATYNDVTAAITHETLSWTAATSGLQTLQFASTGPGYGGTGLDNV